MSKILVIDDSPGIREATQELLEAEGFEVYGAENGQSGLDIANRQPPDLILCDVMMPGLDGYDVLRGLQRDELTADIPFIFLTAKSSKADQRQGMELGADDYLTKPFSRDELLQAIRARLSRQSGLKDRFQRKLDDLRNNLAQSLPHELNTPLSIILMTADTLQNDELSPEENREMCRMLDTAARRLQNLIEKFLLYSELEILWADHNQHYRPPTFIPPGLPIQPTISEIAHNKANQMRRMPDLKLDFNHFPDQSLKLSISDKWFKRLVEELIDNAFRYSRLGKPVSVRVALENDQLVMTFHDQGRGMTPAQIANVGAYVQFDRKLHEQQGSGLGLTIVSRLAELHGGSFEVESISGEYTRVTIKLPTQIPASR